MNKALLPFTLILFFCVTDLVSQVPNGNFESWSSGNPDNWQTTNIPIMPQSILPDTDATSGNYSVKGVVVSNIQNRPFPPYLGMMGNSAGGFPISQPFDKVDGWCKLFLNPGDHFRGIAHIYNSYGDPVAEGVLVIDTSASSWTPFEISITYDSIVTGLSCALYFTITDATGVASGQIGSYFLIDQLSMTRTFSTSIADIKNDVRIYPNPAREFIRIVSTETNPEYFSIKDMAGKTILSGRINNRNEYLSLVNLRAGMYILTLTDGEKTYTRKITRVE